MFGSFAVAVAAAASMTTGIDGCHRKTVRCFSRATFPARNSSNGAAAAAAACCKTCCHLAAAAGCATTIGGSLAVELAALAPSMASSVVALGSSASFHLDNSTLTSAAVVAASGSCSNSLPTALAGLPAADAASESPEAAG